MKRNIGISIVCICMCLLSGSTAFAAGFALYEGSVRANALGGSVIAKADDTASAALTTLGLSTTRVRNLVLKWSREREKATPDFSLSILENLVKAKVMPEDVAQRYLAAQGWTSEQQMYLLMYWLGRRTPPREA